MAAGVGQWKGSAAPSAARRGRRFRLVEELGCAAHHGRRAMGEREGREEKGRVGRPPRLEEIEGEGRRMMKPELQYLYLEQSIRPSRT